MGRPKKPPVLHYKVLCISMYVRDIEELEAKVDALKARGWTKANKSHLIRIALAQLDVESLPIPRHEDASRRPAASAEPPVSPRRAAARPTT